MEELSGMPASSTININSFTRWEQAFRVFSNIYSKANPHRSAELIKYNHVIHTIAMAYVWDNVYTYDKEFCMLMGRNLHRSWAIILQQAWSLRLHDRLFTGHSQNHSTGTPGGMGGSNRNKINEPCRCFNRGKCNFGTGCKFDHRCSYCLKFGHGVLHCRKANGDHRQGSSLETNHRREGHGTSPNKSNLNNFNAEIDNKLRK